MLQPQISRYRARAAAAHEPVLYPMLDAIPVIPKSGAPVAPNGHEANSRLLARIAVAVTVVAAMAALMPDTGIPPSAQDADVTGWGVTAPFMCDHSGIFRYGRLPLSLICAEEHR